MRRAVAQSPARLARARFAAQVMRKPLRAMKRELAGVRQNEDIECVHRMRVASRRLRNALGLFGDELPVTARERRQKRLKGVTKSLGAARDLDVQIAFLKEYLHGLGTSCQEDRPGIEYVLATLTARREAAQAEVMKALDRLTSSRVLAWLADWAHAQAGDDERPTDTDELRAEAGGTVLRRLEDLLAFEPYVEQPEAVKELHAMRIAAKRLRYTLEAYAPLYADGLAPQIQWSRQLQDWLGEIHDCDVWQVELDRLADELAARAPRRGRQEPAPARLRPGIAHLRRERAERRAAVYEEFRSAWRQAGETGYWDEFRRPFGTSRVESWRARLRRRPARAAPTLARGAAQDEGARSGPVGRGARAAGAFGVEERLQPVFELARSCRYEVEHTHHVTRLALDLFGQLAKLHGLGDEHRFWLTSAGLLHDIGWIEGRAGHHKTALRLIADSPRLPWDDRLRRIIGLVARYHRKALPRSDDEHYADLSVRDREAVRKLAAILRIADALDYSHARIVEEVVCRVTAKRISIRCLATRAEDVECARAVEKGDLAARVFDREVIATWRRG